MLTPIKAGHIVYSLCDAWEGAGYCSISWRPLEAQQRNFHVLYKFKTVIDGVGKCSIATHVFSLSSSKSHLPLIISGL